jgi:hypothetical protein
MVHLVTVRYIFSRFGMLYRENSSNPASETKSRFYESPFRPNPVYLGTTTLRTDFRTFGVADFPRIREECGATAPGAPLFIIMCTIVKYYNKTKAAVSHRSPN